MKWCYSWLWNPLVVYWIAHGVLAYGRRFNWKRLRSMQFCAFSLDWRQILSFTQQVVWSYVTKKLEVLYDYFIAKCRWRWWFFNGREPFNRIVSIIRINVTRIHTVELSMKQFYISLMRDLIEFFVCTQTEELFLWIKYFREWLFTTTISILEKLNAIDGTNVKFCCLFHVYGTINFAALL